MLFTTSLIILGAASFCISQETSYATENGGSCSSCPQPIPSPKVEYTTGCDNCELGDATGRPNIVFMLFDDWGWGDVGVHGTCKTKTPNIDTLFYSGIALNKLYAHTVCTPSRSAFLTGILAQNNGMNQAALLGTQPYGVPLENKTIADYMRSAGYKTRIVGKWNNGLYKQAYWPLNRGFDSFRGFLGSHHNYDYGWIVDPKPSVNTYTVPQLINDPLLIDSTVGGWDRRIQNTMSYENVSNFQIDDYDAEVEKIITLHNKSCPLFLYYAHPAPHVDNQNRLPALDANLQQLKSLTDTDIKRLKMEGLVKSMDDSVGKVMTALSKSGLLEKTIVVVASDNGADETSGTANSNPLRGVKFSQWEGGIRSTGAIWTANITEGRVYNGRMHFVDFMATLLSAAGVKDIDLGNVDSVDQWDSIINNKPSPRNNITHEINTITGVSAVSIKYNNEWYKQVTGSIFGGAFDGYFGPSDRNNCIYNINDIYNSSAYKAINKTISPLTILKMRKALTVNCNPNTPVTCHPNVTSSCLFKIDEDECEKTDVSDQYPEVVAECKKVLEEGLKKVVPTRFTLFDNRGDPKYWCNEWTNWGDHLNLQ